MGYKTIRVIYISILIYFLNGKGHEDPSLLDIQEQIITAESGRIINFKCSSSIPTMMCSVEFLLKNITVDNLRLTKKICYHMAGVCDPNVCTCSEDCRSFKLNYTDLVNMKTFSFGCSARFEDDMQNAYTSTIFKFFNGTASYYYKKESQNDNNHSSSMDKEIKYDAENEFDNTCPTCKKSSSWKWVAVVELMMLLGIGLTFVIICNKNYRKKGRNQRQNEGEEMRLLDIEQDTFGLSAEKCMSHHCHTCNVPATCAICIDCETRYCEICCEAHTKYYNSHSVCQMQHVFSRDTMIKCKVCCQQRAAKVCSACNKIICSDCVKSHLHDGRLLLPLNPKWKRQYTVSTSKDGDEIVCEQVINVHSVVESSPTRISGLAFLSDGRVVVADMNNDRLQVYANQTFKMSFDLDDEPRGIVSMDGNKIAVTYRHLRKIAIYTVTDGTIEESNSVDIGKNKPFAISHNKGHFAVEVNEREDGQIFITDENKVLHRIMNNKCAYFTGNTIRLALDIDDEKVFVSAMSKKSVTCINFSGDMLWSISMPSPRSMVLLSGSTCKSLIVASRRCSAVYRLSTTSGQDEVLMAKDMIDSPRYMAVDENHRKLCIEVGIDEPKILIYNLNTDNIKHITQTTSETIQETGDNK